MFSLVGCYSVNLNSSTKGGGDLPTICLTTLDICQFLGGQQPEIWQLAFSQTEFPTPLSVKAAIIKIGSKHDSNFQKVKKAILNASYDGNSPVVLNMQYEKVFVCQFCINGSKNKNKALDGNCRDENIGGHVP